MCMGSIVAGRQTYADTFRHTFAAGVPLELPADPRRLGIIIKPTTTSVSIDVSRSQDGTGTWGVVRFATTLLLQMFRVEDYGQLVTQAVWLSDPTGGTPTIDVTVLLAEAGFDAAIQKAMG